MSNYQFKLEPQQVSLIKTRHRLISTELPCVGTKESLAKLHRYESRSMQGQLPLVWDKAEGYNVYDAAGNKWIDFTSTIFVSNTGHSNTHVIDSIRKALDKPLMHTYAYAHGLRAKYLEALVHFARKPFEKGFLLSAGTEATEAALKLMRLNGLKNNKRKLGIICIENNWHGRTMGAQLMSSNTKQKEWIGFEDPNIHYIKFPYPWECEEKDGQEFLDQQIKELESSGVSLKDDICGFMLETFQGWGAVFYPKSFVHGIKALCEKNDTLLTFDEMQSGFARTGKKFGYEHYEVTPDLICIGKGMASGLPLSGVLGKAEIMDLPEVGNMSSTHSANPICCAAGMATIDEIDNKKLVEKAYNNGVILDKYLHGLKEKHPKVINYIFGKGMIWALLMKSPVENISDAYFTSMVVEKCFQKGLLVVHTGRESIKIAPPLTIPDEALIEGVEIVDESISECTLECKKEKLGVNV